MSYKNERENDDKTISEIEIKPKGKFFIKKWRKIMNRWLTPEEIQIRKERKRKLGLLMVPLLGVLLGAIVVLMTGSL